MSSGSTRRPTLLGIPFDGASSSMRGAADGPRAIRAALRSPHSNSFSEALHDVLAPGALDDFGDVDCASDERAAIERAATEVISRGGAVVALGGDHSIS